MNKRKKKKRLVKLGWRVTKKPPSMVLITTDPSGSKVIQKCLLKGVRMEYAT